MPHKDDAGREASSDAMDGLAVIRSPTKDLHPDEVGSVRWIAVTGHA